MKTANPAHKKGCRRSIDLQQPFFSFIDPRNAENGRDYASMDLAFTNARR